MKFQNGISEELGAMLLQDLQRYIKEVAMTDNEYKELCQWVQSGNSPYNNGWDIATDAGTPMDYINAKRIVESQIDSVKKNNPF